MDQKKKENVVYKSKKVRKQESIWMIEVTGL